MKVTAFTGGIHLPSARMRVRQYIPSLARQGIELREFTLPYGKSRPRSLVLQPLWLAATFAQRSYDLLRSGKPAVTLLSRQMMPAFLPLEGFTRNPRVLDVDDAIWLNRGGERCPRLARMCDSILCGNTFLADYFSQFCRQIAILPTAVNTEAIRPVPRIRHAASPTIGWTGTSDNFRYLHGIEPALKQVLEMNPSCRLRLVSDTCPKFSSIPEERIDFVRWSPAAEIEALQTMTVGIMPLEDSLWARGKCSFKMLCYMAAGVPVVVSPVGMNKEVLNLGTIGYAAQTHSEWVESLDSLMRNRAHGDRMGEQGRRVAVEHFSIEVLGKVLSRELFRAAGVSVDELDAASSMNEPDAVALRGK